MSETQHLDAEKSEQQILPPQQKKPLNWALWLAVGALALSGWQLYMTQLELSSVRHELARRGADPAIKTLSDAQRAADGKVALLEARLNEANSQFATINSMYQDMSKVRTDWLLSEVSHALALASQELQLAGNVPSAISALQAVDARLAAFDRPELIGVKKAVAHDLETLKALPFLDIVGLSARIDSLSLGVDTLPLAVDMQRQPQAPIAYDRSAPFWSRLIRDISQNLGELVRIRRIDKPEAVLLTPEQAFQLRENLKLHLLDARVALLQRNAAPFNADMTALQDYVNRYFDLSAPATKQWLAVLAELKAAPINNALPDLSDSLKAVNSAQATPEVKP
ncbi:MAG: uroporphyrinogen-III C-methyltransferase [Paludibacterium sp.]|uniref:uroporphyrinogen-III C-methyltransferase n=1 Tax=Paludibacterium sp. TaxID=1917523 RepID=UPI0025DD6E40|nr:uroporphyrinogen-III C-methyltransferase [Paludibacterium sp.]MBV8046804.1 uroporphyrinogen-III C-methyltransferase [Paludibacterium sp.]MBV8649326.1 uroporphyrinogen-III C-methyltransferase [Paludibacterium sp.]